MSLDDKLQKDFDERFANDEKTEVELISFMPLDYLLEYGLRFNAKHIHELLRVECPPEKANLYSSQLNGDDVVALVNAKCSPERAEEYGIEEFTGEEIADFHLADFHNGGFGPDDVKAFTKKFPGRFSKWEIFNFLEKEIKPEQVEGYGPGFDGESIADLINGGLFSSFGATISFEGGVTPKDANEFGPRFSGYGIMHLMSKDITAGKAKSYDPIFGVHDIMHFVSKGWDADLVNPYAPRFGGGEFGFVEITQLVEKVPAEIANQYHPDFSGHTVALFFSHNVPPERANKYGRFFENNEIINFDAKTHENTLPSGLRPGYVDEERKKQIKKEFGERALDALLFTGVPPSVTEEYIPQLEGWQVAVLYQIGITPDKKPKEKQEKLAEVLEKITNYTGEEYSSFSLLGSGNEAAVLLKKVKGWKSWFTRKNQAWKFSSKIENEYEMLSKVSKKHWGRQKNVLKLKGKPKEGIALEVEYINGGSLSSLVLEKGILDARNVLKYSAGIMNGIYELREAGIWYHRDIRPENIMVDKNRAVIIDMGIATEDKNARQVNNRRYGPPSDELPNDLVSLGQVMYFMATGKHIFAQSESMTKTFSDIADEIHDYRTEVYADKTGGLLQDHLDDVDKNVGGEVGELIKACLKSKDDDFDKVHEMFQRYAS